MCDRWFHIISVVSKAPFYSEMVIHDSGISIVVAGWKGGITHRGWSPPFLDTNSSQDIYTLLKRIFRGDLGLNVGRANKMHYV